MVKLKGVIIFPALFDEQLHKVKGVSSEYQIMIDRLEGCATITVFFESFEGTHRESIEAEIRRRCRERIGLTFAPKPSPRWRAAKRRPTNGSTTATDRRNGSHWDRRRQ